MLELMKCCSRSKQYKLFHLSTEAMWKSFVLVVASGWEAKFRSPELKKINGKKTHKQIKLPDLEAAEGGTKGPMHISFC